MTTDHDPSSGYLPPHELRALIGSLQDSPGHDPDLPGPRPGLGVSTGAASPSSLAPTVPSDDPGSLALAIARVAGEHLAGASVIPLLHGPELASPGISPQLVANFPEPVSLSHHGDDLRMPLVPTTSDVASPPPHAGPQAFDPSSSPPAVWSPPLAGLAATPPTEVGENRGTPPTEVGENRGVGHPGVEHPSAGHPGAGHPSAGASVANDRGAAQRSDVAATSFAMPSSAMLPEQEGVEGPALPWFPREPLLMQADAAPSGMPSAMPGVSSVPAVDALHMVGSELRVPFAVPEPWDELASVPVQDHVTSGMPPMGGLGALQSPPGPPVIEELGGGGAMTEGIGGSGGRSEVFDPYRVRRDFPILEERVHGGKRLVWLDNAATTQKPRPVIERLTYYYEHENSNVHRGAHALAARATDAFESARETTRKFLNAPSASEIVFVRGATEGINLIAKTLGDARVQEGDEIVLTHLEHHANIVPWQQLAQRKGARLRVAPVDDRGDVIVEAYERLLGSRTKIVAFTQVSNALGTITPAREMIDIAHRYGATVVLDGAQAVSHMPVDVQALDCDFYVFSGHKVFAPTGIGAVFGKRQLLERMPPWQGGGNMIQDVTFERTVYQPPPWRFEAGTGNIADAAGMGAALDYVMRIGMPIIDAYEHGLLEYGTERLRDVPGLRMIGTSRTKAGVLSFVLEGQRTEDVGAALDKHGIAVRSGHHCAQPIHRRFGIESTVRASLAFYNVREDIDALVAALIELQTQRVTVR